MVLLSRVVSSSSEVADAKPSHSAVHRASAFAA